jgi:indole-3-glycerol phosphate synthase
MMTILETIFEAKRIRVAAAKRQADINELTRSVMKTRESHRLRAALEQTGRLNIIAEFKRASPSKGVLNDSADPAATATLYEEGGAAAISVLTEEDHFRGSLDDLRSVRETVSIPVLRKDFIFDEFQVLESAAAGADAVLLIAGFLDRDRLVHLRQLAEEQLGLDALVEVHTTDEMRIAADAGATIVGVNNRDLKTFEVSLDVSRDLAKVAPEGAILVAESGLKSRDDLVELRSLGYSGFLIGETLMRDSGALASLIGEGTVL